MDIDCEEPKLSLKVCKVIESSNLCYIRKDAVKMSCLKLGSHAAKYVCWLTREMTKIPLSHHTYLLNVSSTMGMMNELVENIEKFEKNLSRMPVKDIYTMSYNELMEMIKKVEEIPTKKMMRELAQAKAPIIYENDRCIIRKLEDKWAAIKYGKGTKWCISSLKNSNFEFYAMNGTHLFVILPKDGNDDLKYAVEVNPLVDNVKFFRLGFNRICKFWNVCDKEHSIETYKNINTLLKKDEFKWLDQYTDESKVTLELALKAIGCNSIMIEPDGSVCCKGNMSLERYNEYFVENGKLKYKFKYVEGYFSCANSGLTTLEGCPKQVIGDFICNGNELTTLEGGPSLVTGSYYCGSCGLKSLKGAPNEISGRFECNCNNLENLEGAPEIGVHEDFVCAHNKLSNLIGMPKYIGRNLICYGNKETMSIYPNDCKVKGLISSMDFIDGLNQATYEVFNTRPIELDLILKVTDTPKDYIAHLAEIT